MEEEAAQLLWERFFARLSNFANQKIYSRHKRLFDGDDIASSALFALVDGLKNKRFTRLSNRDALWQLLVVIASRKISNEGQYYDRIKRGGGKVVDFKFADAEDAKQLTTQLENKDGENFVEFDLICDELLESLPNAQYREIAMHRLAGYNNDEIAKKLDCSKRTIERKLKTIQLIWLQLEE